MANNSKNMFVLGFLKVLSEGVNKIFEETKPKNSRVGYVCIEESFGTIFNMGWGGEAYSAPPPLWLMGRENRLWPKGLNKLKKRSNDKV